jgi:hypothetical protein
MIPPENKENFTYAIEIRQLTIVSEIEIFSMRLINSYFTKKLFDTIHTEKS